MLSQQEFQLVSANTSVHIEMPHGVILLLQDRQASQQQKTREEEMVHNLHFHADFNNFSKRKVVDSYVETTDQSRQ